MPGSCPVAGGPLLLHHVLFRFVINALRLMQPGDPQRHVLGVRTRRQREQVLVTVSCTGPGLPPEVLSRLSDPFVSVPLPASGTWLDLSACQALVEALGGKLWVESQPGHGATFSVLLPVGEPDREERIVPPAVLARIRGDASLPRVLQRHGRNATRAMAACFALNLRPLLGSVSFGLEYVRTRVEETTRELKTHPELLSSFEEKLDLIQAFVTNCLGSVSRLGDVLRDLRHLVHRPPEATVLLDVHAIMDVVVRPMIKEVEQTARMRVDLAIELPGVLGSEGSLQTVFRHVIRYALHSMKNSPSGPHELGIRTRSGKGRVRVEISDTSRGFKPGELPRALEPFFNPELLWSGDFGPGLGLSISESIVQTMGGELMVESQEEGHGTTYSVLLPVG
jgi:signal transduction histidine kinase